MAGIEWCSHSKMRIGQKKKGKKERKKKDAEVSEWRMMAEEIAKRAREPDVCNFNPYRK